MVPGTRRRSPPHGRRSGRGARSVAPRPPPVAPTPSRSRSTRSVHRPPRTPLLSGPEAPRGSPPLRSLFAGGRRDPGRGPQEGDAVSSPTGGWGRSVFRGGGRPDQGGPSGRSVQKRPSAGLVARASPPRVPDRPRRTVPSGALPRSPRRPGRASGVHRGFPPVLARSSCDPHWSRSRKTVAGAILGVKGDCCRTNCRVQGAGPDGEGPSARAPARGRGARGVGTPWAGGSEGRLRPGGRGPRSDPAATRAPAGRRARTARPIRGPAPGRVPPASW